MFSKTFVASAALSGLFLVSSAFGQKSTIAGVALDSNNHPIKNAEIRVQKEDTKSAAVVTKTDAKGQFNATGLPAGSYIVAVLVGGKVMSATPHVKASDNQTARVNLGGKKAAAAPVAATTTHKRSVYVQPSTGSHIVGGGYEERDTTESQSLDNASQRELQRLQTRTQVGGGN